MNLKRVAMLVVLLAIPALWPTALPAKTPKRAAPSSAAVRAAFERMIAGAVRDELRTMVAPLDGQWFRIETTLTGEVRYDVRRTDSVVAPYVGLIYIPTHQRIYSSQPTRAKAKYTTVVATTEDETVILRYGYTDGRWKYQGRDSIDN